MIANQNPNDYQSRRLVSVKFKSQCVIFIGSEKSTHCIHSINLLLLKEHFAIYQGNKIKGNFHLCTIVASSIILCIMQSLFWICMVSCAGKDINCQYYIQNINPIYTVNLMSW